MCKILKSAHICLSEECKQVSKSVKCGIIFVQILLTYWNVLICVHMCAHKCRLLVQPLTVEKSDGLWEKAIISQLVRKLVSEHRVSNDMVPLEQRDLRALPTGPTVVAWWWCWGIFDCLSMFFQFSLATELWTHTVCVWTQLGQNKKLLYDKAQNHSIFVHLSTVRKDSIKWQITTQWQYRLNYLLGKQIYT